MTKQKPLDETPYDALEIERHHDEQHKRREAREQAVRRRRNRSSRHRMRLVDDIINRLWGRPYGQ